MGGKQKQAQRTKNNARPSSSSRSAEKLGANVPVFVGFSANKDGGYTTVLPGFSSTENFDTNVDPNVQIIIRKLLKKDPVTKLKALNEFIAYINMTDEETLCTILSLWPRIYCQLCSDCNHRVREVTQIAHGTLVTKCGRSIAPYLKQLIPVWLVSQYDTYMPAKAQAKEALEKVFPQKKIPEVVAFCRNEIFSYICDNLIVHTSSTLSNPKLFTPEECEAIYERTVVMSLQGYEFFVNNLPDEHMEWLYEKQIKLLDSKKFWNLQNLKSSLIKSRFCAVIGCLCRRVTQWFTPKYGKTACEILFKQLTERDFDLLVSVWENVILLMAYVSNWWEYVDLENEVLKNIFDVLSDGGRNCATGIGPLLLPLMVHLSVTQKDKIVEFYTKFLNSLCTGLEQRSVISSKSGCSAWLSGLVECLQHIANNTNTETESITQILSQTMRSWIRTVMEPKPFSSSFNHVKLNSIHLADISIMWTRQSLSGDAKSKLFSHVVRIFWQNFLYVISMQIDSLKPNEDDVKKVTDLHIDVLLGLKNSSNNKNKISSRVTFSDIEKETVETKGSAERTNPTEDKCVMQDYQRSLNNVAHEVCAKYLSYAKLKNLSSPILIPLHSIVREFDSPQLHLHMTHILTKDPSAGAIKLYSDCYASWLRCDSMRSQSVVDLTFILINHLPYEDQANVLKSFDQLPLPVIKWCISRCISRPYSSISAVCDWLQSDTVHESLVALSKLVITQGDKHHLDLLKTCFSYASDEVITINKKTCSSVLHIISDSLYDLNSEHLDLCADLASYLSLTDNVNITNTEDHVKLLISLFTLNCNTQAVTYLSQEDIGEINSSWSETLSKLSIDHLNDFIGKSAAIIHEKLIENNDPEKHLSTIDILVSLSVDIINSCKDIKNGVDLQNIAYLLLNIDPDEIKPGIDKIMLLSLLTDIISGKLYSSSSDSAILKGFADNANPTVADLNVKELRKLSSWLLFSMRIFESVMNSDYINMIDASQTCNILMDILHYIAAIKTIHVEYKAWSWYNDLATLYDPLMKSTINMINNLNEKNYQKLYDMVKRRFQNEGFYWTICLYMCEHNLRMSKSITSHSSEIDCILNNLIDKLDVETFDELLSIEFYHSLQVLKNEKHINDDDSLTMKVACVLAMRSLYLTHFVDKNDLPISFNIDEFKSGITSPLISLTTIIDMYYIQKEIMLYDKDITDVGWDLVNCNSSIVRFLTTCVNISGWEMETHHWDFIMISLSSFLQSLEKSKKEWDSPKVTLFATAVFELFCTVKKFIASILPESARREPSQIHFQLVDEWRDLFAPGAHHNIFEIFMTIFGDCVAPNRTISPLNILFVSSLHNVVENFEWSCIKSKYPEKVIVEKLKVCLEIMASPSHHILKYINNEIMKGLTPLLIEVDKRQGDTSNESTDENSGKVEPVPVDLSIHIIEPTLIHIQECMEAVLSPYKIGEDNCILLPYTDGHSIALGYLFLWEILLDIAQESNAYLQHEYSEFFKNGQYVEQMLNLIFKLLPAELVEQSSVHSSKFFKNKPILSYKEPINWDLIGRLACQRLLRCLQGGWLGVFVRGWWSSLPTKTAQYVENVVQTHVSPILIANQLAGVTKNQNTIADIEINVHPSVNEIVCIYLIEDMKMGLTVQLCKNHPLNKPLVITNGTPLNNMTWLSMYLSHQNGSVFQAIRMWTNAVQKKVESTPVCYVCYSRLHSTTGQLPKLLCTTCKNKYHTACLYRWFSTSGNMTCPLCRNTFTIPN